MAPGGLRLGGSDGGLRGLRGLGASAKTFSGAELGASPAVCPAQICKALGPNLQLLDLKADCSLFDSPGTQHHRTNEVYVWTSVAAIAVAATMPARTAGLTPLTVLKVGRVAIISRGRYAGKKVRKTPQGSASSKADSLDVTRNEGRAGRKMHCAEVETSRETEELT